MRQRINRRQFLTGSAAVGISITLPHGVFAQDGGKVNFYNWDTYIGENTIEEFEKSSGIKVQYDLYADNDELFAKLKGGNPGYDLIIPSNDYIEQMLAADMLEPLDMTKIPNATNVSEAFMDPSFDPGRKHSLPYMWGTIGIGYRKSAVDGEITSWADLFDSDKYSGRIALMNESRTVLQMAMKYRGKSLNDWTDENLAEAEALIIKQKPHITAFAQDNGQDLLLSGEVDLAMEWNGDILQIMEEDDDIGYVVPDEGTLLWEDAMCIPKGGENIENAHALINHLLDGEVGAGIAEYVYYATPNTAAQALMDADYLENPAIFPSAESTAISEAAVFPGTDWNRKIDEAWTRVKSAG